MSKQVIVLYVFEAENNSIIVLRKKIVLREKIEKLKEEEKRFSSLAWLLRRNRSSKSQIAI
jgi:hypothetical protein